MRIATVLLCLAVAGCGGSDERVTQLETRLNELETQIAEAKLNDRVEALELENAAGVLESLRPLIKDLTILKDELRQGTQPLDTINARRIELTDQTGTTRILLEALPEGGHMWLADHREKRILLIASKPSDPVGDISGIVFQHRGGTPIWETPKVK